MDTKDLENLIIGGIYEKNEIFLEAIIYEGRALL